MNKQELEQRRKYRVVMANTVINDMSYKLSLQQLKVLRYMISQIQPTDSPNKLYTMSVKEYCDVCGIDGDSGKNSRDIKSSFDAIDRQVQWIRIPNTRKNVRVRWFNRLIVSEGSGIIEYSWHEDIIEFLFDLVHSGKPYTNYMQEENSVMESRYAFRLFELMKEYHNLKRKVVVFPIDLLKQQLDAEKYERYPDFRRFVLDVAVKEINRYADFNIAYEGQKIKSRAITHISFSIEDLGESELVFGFAAGEREKKLNKTLPQPAGADFSRFFQEDDTE